MVCVFSGSWRQAFATPTPNSKIIRECDTNVTLPTTASLTGSVCVPGTRSCARSGGPATQSRRRKPREGYRGVPLWFKRLKVPLSPMTIG